MKYILRFVLLFAVLFACKPMRQLPDVQASNLPVKNPALLTASADTLPALVNAAQTSELVAVAPNPTSSEPELHRVKKPSVFKTLRMVRQLKRMTPQDTSRLYTRRATPDLRPMNRLANTSMWMGILAFVFFVVGILLLGILLGAIVSTLFAIAALVTGIVSLSDFRRHPDLFRGKQRAVVGITLGGTFLFITLLLAAIITIILLTQF